MKFTPLTSASALLGRTRRQRYQQIAGNDENRDNESEVSNDEHEREREENHALIHTKLWTLELRKHKRLATALLSFIGIFVIVSLATAFYRKLPEASCDTVQHGYHCQPSISQYWGQYSPYFSVPSEIPPELPASCSLTFAQVLSRHGSRDPTLGKSLRYSSLITRIHSQTTSYGKAFIFLKSYDYALGADQLTLFGQQQMINSGQQFYTRYAELTRTHTPFIRASGQQRVVKSAQNWTQGFHLSRLDDEFSNSPEEYPYDILSIPETLTSNNTLSYGLCTNFHSSFGLEAQSKFAAVFAPSITSRLNDNLPGANLTDDDTIAIMDLCPFSTVAHPTGQLSPFCALFTEAEWKGYDYYQSLGKFYGFTFPNPLAPTQGVGFVNELIARLTGEKVEDETCSNSTLDGDESTFPVVKGGGGVYADFSHDNDMSTVFAALGLYNETKWLGKEEWENRDGKSMRGYSAAYTVPFAGRMYVEKMACGAGGGSEGEEEEFVRILVNDRVMAMETCGGDEFGRCKLENFVESLGFARGGGHWDQCFTDEGDDSS